MQWVFPSFTVQLQVIHIVHEGCGWLELCNHSGSDIEWNYVVVYLPTVVLSDSDIIEWNYAVDY